MQTAETEDAFGSFLRSRDLDLAELRGGAAIVAWIEFYEAQRVDDVAKGMAGFGSSSAPTTGGEACLSSSI